MKKILFSIAAVLATASISFGQSQGFKLGQWVEIQNAILKELNRNYVDSLPVSRIQRSAIDAMLESLDPYTVYVPEEENEDFQMQIGKVYGGIGAVIYKPEKDGYVYINEPYAGAPAAKNGLVCGDQIMEIDPRYYYLYQIRPGVTSYATLKNGYTDTMEKMIRRLEFDLYYLRHRSMFFDAKILFQTFMNIVFGKKF